MKRLWDKLTCALFGHSIKWENAMRGDLSKRLVTEYHCDRCGAGDVECTRQMMKYWRRK